VVGLAYQSASSFQLQPTSIKYPEPALNLASSKPQSVRPLLTNLAFSGQERTLKMLPTSHQCITNAGLSTIPHDVKVPIREVLPGSKVMNPLMI
jgi:hypothetical protein